LISEKGLITLPNFSMHAFVRSESLYFTWMGSHLNIKHDVLHLEMRNICPRLSKIRGYVDNSHAFRYAPMDQKRWHTDKVMIKWAGVLFYKLVVFQTGIPSELSDLIDGSSKHGLVIIQGTACDLTTRLVFRQASLRGFEAVLIPIRKTRAAPIMDSDRLDLRLTILSFSI
jgi:hypothetical protein